MRYPGRFFILIMLFMASCHTNTTLPLPDPAGAPGEVLVVMMNEDWQNTPGEACRELFGQPYEVLPQYEPLFDIQHISFESWENFLLMHRNTLVGIISPEVSEEGMSLQYEPHAATQLVITLQASSDSSFVRLMTENGDRILTLFEELARQRIQTDYRQIAADRIMEKINISFGFTPVVPDGYSMALDTTDFIWLTKETGTIILGILVYNYPHDQNPELTDRQLVNMRNNMVERFIPGSGAGSYMTTELEFGPFMETYLLNGQLPVKEMRGLWKTVNGISMGGPFLSITLDSSTGGEQKFTTIEGFVYAAGHNKRNYMREVEAIVLSTQ